MTFGKKGESSIRNRVLVVGLDGATWDILRPLAMEGRLPHLRRMIDRGASGVLQSTVPPVTPAAWTSVFTGKNPGRHGIYDFQKIDPQTYEFKTIRAHRHREKTLWQLVGEGGKRAILIDVPFTFPPQPLNGLMLTGYGTPRTPQTRFTFPQDFASVLPASLHGEIRVALPENNFDRSQRFIDEWTDIMQGRGALLRHLISQEVWDYFMVVFSITDNMAHVFWTFADPAHPNYHRSEAESFRRAFYQSYERCDQLLGELMTAAGDDTITLVISDHGFGSVRPRQYMFQRLLQGGYLQAGAGPDGAKTQTSGIRKMLLNYAVKVYARYPGLREVVKGLQPGRRQLLKDTLQKAGALPNASAIDYGRSTVILSNFGLQLWINEVGRFAQGTVGAADKEALLKRLTNYLLADKDPVTGQPVISAVHRGRDAYDGPFLEQCPDLIIEYNNLFARRGAKGEKNGHTEGGHTHDGILLARGPGVLKTNVSGARLIDLAPTVLYLLGLPLPPDMDGRVLSELFTTTFKQQRTLLEGDVPAVNDESAELSDYSVDEEAELREQLRQLGYL